MSFKFQVSSSGFTKAKLAQLFPEFLLDLCLFNFGKLSYCNYQLKVSQCKQKKTNGKLTTRLLCLLSES